MPLTKLVFRPGINRETTAYANEGGWWDSNLVRFRAGKPESIGGWTRYTKAAMLGTGRSLLTWTALDGTILTGMGTNLKYYVIRGGGLYDITPLRETTLAGAVSHIILLSSYEYMIWFDTPSNVTVMTNIEPRRYFSNAQLIRNSMSRSTSE
jgi:hypothetical protein